MYIIHDLIGSCPCPPTYVFSNEINKSSMLKEVQTWEIFLQNMGDFPAKAGFA